MTLDVAAVFESPSVADLARRLDEATVEHADEVALVHEESRGPQPVSTVQTLVLRAERPESVHDGLRRLIGS